VQLYILLAAPLTLGVALVAYAQHTGACAYPCGVIHPYRTYGYIVVFLCALCYAFVTLWGRKN